MATTRITVRIPVELARRMKEAAAGKPMSSWVTELIEQRLDDAELERQWQAFYRDVNPGPRVERKAKKILDQLTKPAPRAMRAT